MTSTSLARRALRLAPVVWVTFGLVQCAQSWVYALAAGRAWNLVAALVGSMPWWLSWLALTPLIAWLAGRYPFADGRAWRSLGAHVIASVGIACGQLTAVGAVYWLTTGRTGGVATSMGNQIQRFFGNYFLESVLTYAATAGVFIAIDFARAARDQTVARAKLEAETAALEASVSKARLEALSMELNPHFLFNTLGAIASLVSQGRPTEAREVIERLSGLLRRTLGCGNGQLSSVTTELDLLDDYLYIQRVRFSDRLRVTMEVDDAARDCAIPTMLLQPLVENAIRHGIEHREGVGNVRVQVGRIAGSLRVAIADSGFGFAFDASGRPAREGVGIANTRARLAHLFGDDAALVLRNVPEGGAEAIVVLPALEAPVVGSLA
jgi:two-component system, LytTR family, sensor kinase